MHKRCLSVRRPTIPYIDIQMNIRVNDTFPLPPHPQANCCCGERSFSLMCEHQNSRIPLGPNYFFKVIYLRKADIDKLWLRNSLMTGKSYQRMNFSTGRLHDRLKENKCYSIRHSIYHNIIIFYYLSTNMKRLVEMLDQPL